MLNSHATWSSSEHKRVLAWDEFNDDLILDNFSEMGVPAYSKECKRTTPFGAGGRFIPHTTSMGFSDRAFTFIFLDAKVFSTLFNELAECIQGSMPTVDPSCNELTKYSVGVGTFCNPCFKSIHSDGSSSNSI